jgi:hypothetical protein
MTIRIYGAGMAGLLAANMLRRARPVVHEAQAVLPNNHGALLRFRTDAVARETAQPFRQVRVLKAVKRAGRLRTSTTIQDANQYSYKVTGAVAPRSVLDLSPCDRYIAPDNFLTMMARDAVLKMGCALTPERLSELEGQREIAGISTIPMPVLMKLVDWPNRPTFGYRPIWSMTVELGAGVDVFQTIYYPEPEVRPYRASITGHKLIVEWAEDPGDNAPNDALMVVEDFGLRDITLALSAPPVKRQEYGKLLPIAREHRHEFIMAMTDRYNLYSVGRFATWRQILLDDVVRDMTLVAAMITERSAYHRRLHNDGVLGG